MGQIFRHFLHAFSVNSGVKLKVFFAEVFCVVSKRCVKVFNLGKRIKDNFNFFYILCPKKTMPPNFDNKSAC